jgi:hypothetical protein
MMKDDGGQQYGNEVLYDVNYKYQLKSMQNLLMSPIPAWVGEHVKNGGGREPKMWVLF